MLGRPAAPVVLWGFSLKTLRSLDSSPGTVCGAVRTSCEAWLFDSRSLGTSDCARIIPAMGPSTVPCVDDEIVVPGGSRALVSLWAKRILKIAVNHYTGVISCQPSRSKSVLESEFAS